jgi:large subunit ribosomal protein L3
MITNYYGTKQKMTQAWDKRGKRYPVTVIQVSPLTVTQVKNLDQDGYQALQVGWGEAKKTNKPMAGHLKKVTQTTPKRIREVKVASQDLKSVGDQITITEVVKVGDFVTVRGTSKGRGFAGVIKRWGFGGGPRTHGQSDRMRAPGSIGQGTDPGRVHKGKKMAGRYGNQQFAIRNLQVIHLDEANNILWVSGPIPGAPGSTITITKDRDGEFPGLFHQKETDTQVEATKPELEPLAAEAVASETDAAANANQGEEDKAESKND